MKRLAGGASLPPTLAENINLKNSICYSFDHQSIGDLFYSAHIRLHLPSSLWLSLYLLDSSASSEYSGAAADLLSGLVNI